VRHTLKSSRTASVIECEMEMTRESYLSVFGCDGYKPVPDSYERTFKGNFFLKEVFVISKIMFFWDEPSLRLTLAAVEEDFFFENKKKKRKICFGDSEQATVTLKKQKVNGDPYHRLKLTFPCI